MLLLLIVSGVVIGDVPIVFREFGAEAVFSGVVNGDAAASVVFLVTHYVFVGVENARGYVK